MFVRTRSAQNGRMIVSTDIPIVLHKQDMPKRGGAIATQTLRYIITLNLPTEDDDATSERAPKAGASNSKPVKSEHIQGEYHGRTIR